MMLALKCQQDLQVMVSRLLGMASLAPGADLGTICSGNNRKLLKSQKAGSWSERVSPVTEG